MSPSLMSTSRRSTLSRVNVLPTNSRRRSVNCFPSSIVTVKSTMPSFGFCGIVFEGRDRFGGVFDESLLPVKLLEVFKEALAYLFAVGDVAFVETDYCSDLVLGEDRVAFDFELTETINLSFHDRNGDAQSFIDRGQKRQRQDRETGAARAHTLDARLAVARLR